MLKKRHLFLWLALIVVSSAKSEAQPARNSDARPPRIHFDCISTVRRLATLIKTELAQTEPDKILERQLAILKGPLPQSAIARLRWQLALNLAGATLKEKNKKISFEFSSQLIDQMAALSKSPDVDDPLKELVLYVMEERLNTFPYVIRTLSESPPRVVLPLLTTILKEESSLKETLLDLTSDDTKVRGDAEIKIQAELSKLQLSIDQARKDIAETETLKATTQGDDRARFEKIISTRTKNLELHRAKQAKFKKILSAIASLRELERHP